MLLYFIYARDTSANSILNISATSGLAYVVPTIYLPGQLSGRPITITRAILSLYSATSYSSFESSVLGLALSAKLPYSNRKPGLRLEQGNLAESASPNTEDSKLE